MGYVYKVTNNINNKLYVGITSRKRVNDRWSQHRCMGKTEYEGDNSLLHKAMRKYGVDCFSFEVIEEVDNSLLFEREKYWIAYYNSKTPNGYNLTDGGEGTFGFESPKKGVPRSQEVKDKLKASWTEERREEYKQRVLGEKNPMYGKKWSDEYISLFREKSTGENNAFYGKHHTEETRQKISQAQNDRKKKVVMRDIVSQEIIMTFESLSAAGRYIQGDDSYISKACRRKTKTGSNIAYGYAWDFLESVSTNSSGEIDTP